MYGFFGYLVKVCLFIFGVQDTLDTLHGIFGMVAVAYKEGIFECGVDVFHRDLRVVPFNRMIGESNVDPQIREDVTTNDHVVRPQGLGHMNVPFNQSIVMEFRNCELCLALGTSLESATWRCPYRFRSLRLIQF